MNDLTQYRNNLPVTTEDLQRFILIGKESLKAQKAKIRAIEKANMALAAKEAALQDTQDIADILLDAEVKLGEMLDDIDKSASQLKGQDFHRGSQGGTAVKTLPEGITKQQSHEAQELFRHGWAVAKAKEEARKEGRIATSRDVLGKIRGSKPPKPKEDIVSDEFKAAYELLLIEIKNAKALKWRTTSKRVALKYVGILKDVITA